MAGKGFLLSPESIEKLRAMRRQLDSQPPQTGKDTSLGRNGYRAPARWHAWVRITSTTPDSGRYPGVVCDYFADSDTWADVSGTSVWVRRADGGSISSTTAHFWGRLEADAEGGTPGDERPVYLIDEAGTGGTITAKEVDGTPTYTSIDTLSFDQADGFVLTNPSAGVTRIDIAAATESQSGVVSTSDQTFGGRKWVEDDSANPSVLGVKDSSSNYFVLGTSSLTPISAAVYTLRAIISGGLDFGWGFYVGGGNSDIPAGPIVFPIAFGVSASARLVPYGVYNNSTQKVVSGGSATTGGLTFIGGLYISGSLSLASDSVTFSTMQNIATDRLIGRDTSGTGDPEEIALTGGLEFSGSTSIQIADNGVTYAKIQNVSAASKLIGRSSAGGSGDPEEISLGSGLSMSSTTLDTAGASGTFTSNDGKTITVSNGVITSIV